METAVNYHRVMTPTADETELGTMTITTPHRLTPLSLVRDKPDLMAYLLTVGAVSIEGDWDVDTTDNLDRRGGELLTESSSFTVAILSVVTHQTLGHHDLDFVKEQGFLVNSILADGKHRVRFEFRPAPVLFSGFPAQAGREDQSVA